jgi:hypothetical protein
MANAAQRSKYQRGGDPFARGFAKLRELATVTGGADDEGVVNAAKVLVRSIKKVLSKKATGVRHTTVASGGFRKTTKKKTSYGLPSSPGEPPRRQSGALYRSIGTAVVAGVRRVGSGDFTAPILNDGAIIDEQIARAAGAEKFIPTGGARKGKLTSKRARKGHRRLKIEKRPFMEPGLALAKANGMTDAILSGLQKTEKKVLG